MPGFSFIVLIAFFHPMTTSRRQLAASTRPPPRFGLARVLSKWGMCSRSQAEKAVREGRVSVDGHIVRDPEQPADPGRQSICMDGKTLTASKPVYIMLNKPRGIVVSAADEHHRDTVYGLLVDSGLPWLGPVGRLDKASEGLLLLSNDSAWAARLTDPRYHVDKIYHVQIDSIPDPSALELLLQGVQDRGQHLAAKQVSLLRAGAKNAWLEMTLDEGRNRHLRRLLAAQGINVLRLVRVAVGDLVLGTLAKGEWRHLTSTEVTGLSGRPVDERQNTAILNARARSAKTTRSARGRGLSPARRK